MVNWKVDAGENGLLCREGRDLKSAELQRVANGSLLEELQLVGDRLNFRLLSGDGPLTGWISVKVKGKEVAVRQEAGGAPELPKEVEPCTAEDVDLGPSKPPEERPYGIIIYGATGFTGMLAMQHLDAVFAQAGGPKLPWAVAGRNAEKLRNLTKLCKTEVATLVVTTDEEVHKMVSECRVIISAIGPHSRWGEPVIRACVAFGTHYADVAGETWWLKRMIAKYDAEARKRGVVLVIMCAQQATVADVAVNMLVKKLGPLKQVRGYVLQMAFTTGGTDNNGRYTMEVIAKNPHVWEDQRDPFALGGHRKCGVRDSDQDCNFVEKDTLFPKFWLGPLGCATGDLRCVRRSCALFEEARGGRDLSGMVRGAGRPRRGLCALATTASLLAAAWSSWTRPLTVVAPAGAAAGRRAAFRWLLAAAAPTVGAVATGDKALADGVPPWTGRYSDPEHKGCKREVRAGGLDINIEAEDGRPDCDKGKSARLREWSATGRLSLSSYTEAIMDFSKRGGPNNAVIRWGNNGFFMPDGTKWTKIGTLSPAPAPAAAPAAPAAASS